jgi:hypothetical protein
MMQTSGYSSRENANSYPRSLGVLALDEPHRII